MEYNGGKVTTINNKNNNKTKLSKIVFYRFSENKTIFQNKFHFYFHKMFCKYYLIVL